MDHAPARQAPIDVSQIVGMSFRIFQHRWRPHVIASAIAQLPGLLPTLVLLNLLIDSLFTAIASRSFDAVMPTLLISSGLLAVAFLSTFLFVLMSGAACQLVVDWLDGGRPTVLGAYAVALRKFWPLAAAMLGVFAIVFGALVALWAFLALFYMVFLVVLPGGFAVGGPNQWLLIIPSTLVALLAGIVLLDALVRWSVFVQAVVIENRGPMEALLRSAELVRRNWWRTAGAMALLVMVPTVLMIVLAAALNLAFLILVELGIGNSHTANGAAIAVAQVLLTPIPAIGVTVLFYRLRDGVGVWERIDARTRSRP